MTNLTHGKASLYEAFPAEEALALANRLEIHYTPKHGSWLNIAEIELNVMTHQCLDRWLDTIEKISSELSTWESHRNAEIKLVDWHFTTEDARTKLKSLYPKFQTKVEEYSATI